MDLRLLVRWAIVAALVVEAIASHHMHLGCYTIADPTPEMDGLKYHYARLELQTCALGCNREGYAYIALQQGKHCLCVTDFGKGGLTYGSSCTETCYSDQAFSCGGEDTENVYYAVDTDRLVVEERVDIFQTTSLTFTAARKDCVRREGDLLTIINIPQMDSLVTMANQSGVGEPFWIGLSRTSWRQKRRWTVPNVRPLDASDGSMFWAEGHPVADDHCVLLDPTTLKWKSAPCTENHPYVCHQTPPPPTLPPVALVTDPPTTTLNTGALEVEDAFWSQNKDLVLYLMAPLFLGCFGGSCVAYSISKCYKVLKKKTRRRAVGPQYSFEHEGFNVAMNEDETQPPPYTQTPPPKIVHAQAEPEEERQLDELEIDFTKLTIADILYIRALLGMSNKKKKKIASS